MCRVLTQYSYNNSLTFIFCVFMMHWIRNKGKKNDVTKMAFALLGNFKFPDLVILIVSVDCEAIFVLIWTKTLDEILRKTTGVSPGSLSLHLTWEMPATIYGSIPILINCAQSCLEIHNDSHFITLVCMVSTLHFNSSKFCWGGCNNQYVSTITN